jgi:hypothetical protein
MGPMQRIPIPEQKYKAHKPIPIVLTQKIISKPKGIFYIHFLLSFNLLVYFSFHQSSNSLMNCLSDLSV